MIRNYIRTSLIIFTVFFIILPASADDDHDHNITIKEVLTEIRAEQGVTTDDNINSDKISHKLLEKLGEAVMSERFPDPKEHEYMDNMMGGEGSERLKIMHERIGYFYIKNGFRNNGFWGRGMMSGQGYMFNNRNGTTFMDSFYPCGI